MAPEILLGCRDATSGANDIFAAGIVAAELVLGRRLCSHFQRVLPQRDPRHGMNVAAVSMSLMLANCAHRRNHALESGGELDVGR